MKLRSKIIMIIIVSLILVGGVVALLLSPIGNKIKNVIVVDNTKEEIFTAYIDINPLIKLNFKVICDNENNCSSPVVTDSELINEDAKTIYKDLVLKDKSLSETIELLASTVKDNDIAFTEIHIYSNYDNEDAFKVNSVDYSISLNVKQDDDLEKFIDELIVQKETLTTKVITISILEPITVKEKVFELQVYNHDCTQFEFIEHPELYVSRGKVKVTVSGPAELINSLPDSVLEGHAFDFPIKPFIEVNDFTMGEHTTFLNITSEIPEIKVSPSSIKVKYEVRRKGDIPICVVGDV